MKRTRAKASNAAVRGYTGYLARNIRPAMSQIRAQLGELQSTLPALARLVHGLEMWLSWHGLAGQPKHSRRGAARS
jgi:hypothetical protein